MTFQELWALVREAGPLALASVFAYMWWRAETRADRERSINEDRTNKFYDLGTTTNTTLAVVSSTLDKVFDAITSRRTD